MQNVLVCDDDEAILESLRIYLDNAGFNVITAVDGRDALEKVQNNDIHCVVLDIMMPRLDGLKATLKIREKHNYTIQNTNENRRFVFVIFVNFKC